MNLWITLNVKFGFANENKMHREGMKWVEIGRSIATQTHTHTHTHFIAHKVSGMNGTKYTRFNNKIIINVNDKSTFWLADKQWALWSSFKFHHSQQFSHLLLKLSKETVLYCQQYKMCSIFGDFPYVSSYTDAQTTLMHAYLLLLYVFNVEIQVYL